MTAPGPAPPPHAAPRPRRDVALRIALLAAIALAWLPAIDAPFTYDDRVEVVGNRTIRWLADFDDIAAYNTSRPVLILTYALNWWLGGLEPRGYHVLSVAIHMVNALLAWRLAGRLLAPGPAALVATVWALHPMTTEAVTYITGRSDALQATWWLLAIPAWIDHRRGDPRARLVALLSAVGAVLTKETGWLLPAALLASDAFLPDAGAAREGRWREHARFLVVAGLAVALRLVMYGFPAAEVPRGGLAQLLSQAEVWARYAQLWLLPYGQSILHDHPGVARIEGAFALSGWLLLGAAAVVWARGAPPRSGAAIRAFALAIWAAWLFPSSALPLLETMAEHRAYLAGFALILAIGASLPARAVRFAWLVVPVLFAATVARNRVWADEVRLWDSASERNPRSARAWYGAAEALRFAGSHRLAVVYYEEATRLDPTDADAWINLGISRAETGDSEGARAAWQGVLSRDPKSCPAHNNLGGLAFRAGKLDEAVAAYTSTLAWCPDDAIANLNLANIAWQRADSRLAAFHYREYLRVADAGPAAPLARERLKRMGVE